MRALLPLLIAACAPELTYADGVGDGCDAAHELGSQYGAAAGSWCDDLPSSTSIHLPANAPGFDFAGCDAYACGWYDAYGACYVEALHSAHEAAWWASGCGHLVAPDVPVRP